MATVKLLQYLFGIIFLTGIHLLASVRLFSIFTGVHFLVIHLLIGFLVIHLLIGIIGGLHFAFFVVALAMLLAFHFAVGLFAIHSGGVFATFHLRIHSGFGLACAGITNG